MEEKEKAAAESNASSSSVPRYTDADGTVYEYDNAKKGWFPYISEDFLAQYQANYGTNEEGKGVEEEEKGKKEEEKEMEAKKKVKKVDEEKQKREEEEKEKLAAMTPDQRKKYLKEKKKERRKEMAEKEKKRGWFNMDETHNTNVYVTGLPPDVTEKEFQEIMSKCGIVAVDPSNQKLKLKLYVDEDGAVKGDGLCCYIKRESVELALKILDGAEVRGHHLTVESAHFEQKGSFDPKKKRKRLSAAAKKRFKERQMSLFDWRPEKPTGVRPKSDCTVVLKNLFTLEELLENAARLIELQDFLEAECSKWGEVKKVDVYDNNADGVAVVRFAAAEEADDCVTMMNYRRLFKPPRLARVYWREIRASLWDGKTHYKVAESKTQLHERDKHWQEYLEKPSPKPSSSKKKTDDNGGKKVDDAVT